MWQPHAIGENQLCALTFHNQKGTSARELQNLPLYNFL